MVVMEAPRPSLPDFDETQMQERLRMTPAERWEAHRKALDLVLSLRAAHANRLRRSPQSAGASER